MAETPTPERIGRYRIDSLLGEGGMGVVCAAVDEQPGGVRSALDHLDQQRPAPWSRDGKRIFYRSGQQMLIADVIAGGEVRLSTPRPLFDRRYEFGPNISPATSA